MMRSGTYIHNAGPYAAAIAKLSKVINYGVF